MDEPEPREQSDSFAVFLIRRQEMEQRQQAEEGMLAELLQEIKKKKRERDRISEDIFKMERLAYMMAAGNENHPSL